MTKPDIATMANHMGVVVCCSDNGVTVSTIKGTLSVDFAKPEISADDLRSAVEALKDKALRKS